MFLGVVDVCNVSGVVVVEGVDGAGGRHICITHRIK